MKASRAIIIDNKKILLMRRNKEGSQYYTLVGGQLHEGEDEVAALIREVKEETGLTITNARLVFHERHPAPYNEQHIYLCEVLPHDNVGLSDLSDEAYLNRFSVNIHEPVWSDIKSFEKLPFRTPQLQQAIITALKKGFPKQVVSL